MKKEANKIKILICCHKKTELPKKSIYLPVQVGKSRTGLNLEIQSDDEIRGKKCDNISEYNNIYCEMTAAYWAWKNINKLYPDIEYLGLCHYRRYFSDSLSQKRHFIYHLKCRIKEIRKNLLGDSIPWAYVRQKDVPCVSEVDNIVSEKKLCDIIKSSDVTITALSRIYNGNVREFFASIGENHISLLENVVKVFFPEYFDALQTVLNGKNLASGNMVIMKYNYYKEYCTFVFGVLLKHIEKTKEQNVIADPYTDARYSRISGYLSELLTYTYIVKHKDRYKVKMVDCIFIENM